MLVNLTKDEINVILDELTGNNDIELLPQIVSITNKLEPLIDACECQAQKQTSPPN